MPKSKKRRRNGKIKKYNPPPKGISKTRLQKLLQQFKDKNQIVNQDEVAEIRMQDNPLQIQDPSKKSYNVIPTDGEINQGPELSSLKNHSEEK